MCLASLHPASAGGRAHARMTTCWLAILGALLVLPSLAQAQYVFTTIDVPGATRTAVNGNSPNAIAGEYDDADGNTHGFVWTNKGLTQIDHPDAAGFTTVNGINASGELAGIYHDGSRFQGFFYSKGQFTTIEVPGSIRTLAFFLNAKGEVAGVYRDAAQTRHGFVWSKGQVTVIDAPDAATPLGTTAIGINDLGEVVGTYVDANDGNRYGFVVSRGEYASLDVPASDDFTVAQGINNAGTIVGLYVDANGDSHGFVLNGGGFATVDVPGALWTEIYSINAQGQIVGAYEDAGGVHGFVATLAK